MKRNTRDAAAPKRKRKMRSRPAPRWLTKANDLDEIAQRRCLMILRVLSGEQPVTQAIEEAKLTRPHYYLLERRAVEAMVRALMPGAESSESAATTQTGRIRELEEQVKKLEQEKRRNERLLFLTKRVLSSGPLKMSAPGRPRGRPPKTTSDRSSTKTGKKASPRSTSKSKTTEATSNSTPTRDGADAPPSGNEN